MEEFIQSRSDHKNTAAYSQSAQLRLAIRLASETQLERSLSQTSVYQPQSLIRIGHLLLRYVFDPRNQQAGPSQRYDLLLTLILLQERARRFER